MEENTIQSNMNKFIKNFNKFTIYLVIFFMILFFSSLSDKFLTVGNFLNILQQSSALGITTIGIIFVLIVAGLDISVGSTMFFSATISGILLSKNFGIFPSLIAALICGTLIGAINGLLISKFRMPPFIITLAMLGAARGLTLAISGQKTIYLGSKAILISGTKLFGIPLTVYIFLVVLLIGDFVLRKTQFGRQLYAIGNDYMAAEKVGIRVVKNTFLAYMVCGMLAGLGGFIGGAQISAVTTNFASGNEFVVISAAVLGGISLFGGKGNILPGALIGVTTITIIVNGLTIINASPYAYAIVTGLIIFIAVLIDSMKNGGKFVR